MKDLYAQLYEIGTPVSDSEFYPGQQEGNDTCAIRAQQQILQMFGIERSEAWLVAEATEHGEYGQGNGGTRLDDVGNLLAREGIAINRFYGATPAHLIAELAQGHKIIAAVDSGEIWADSLLDRLKEGIEDCFGYGVDHAVVVTGIDPYTYDVTISDPGDGNAMRTIPADIFFDAFKDGGSYMVSTAFAPKDFIPVEDSTTFINRFFSMDEFMEMTNKSQTEIIHTSYSNGNYENVSISMPQFLEGIGEYTSTINPMITQETASVFENVYSQDIEDGLENTVEESIFADLFGFDFNK